MSQVKRMNTAGAPTIGMFVGDEIIYNTVTSTAYILLNGVVRALNHATFYPESYDFTSPSEAPTEAQGYGIKYRARTSTPDGLFYIVNDGGTGVTINANTGTMSGGESASVGVHTITLECTNSIGTTGNFNLTWEVTS